MKLLIRLLTAAVLGAGALSFSAVNASAAIACVGPVCWHTHEVYEYPRAAGVVVHEDTWHAGPGVKFREHEGRGYWKGGRWREW